MKPRSQKNPCVALGWAQHQCSGMALPPTAVARGAFVVFSSFSHPNIKQVNSFEELCETPFVRGVNALYWPRVLQGDFSEIVTGLGAANEEVMQLDAALLEGLPLSPEGSAARALLLADVTRLRERGLEPELNCIGAYPSDPSCAVARDESRTDVEQAAEDKCGIVLPTDVYSFHVDEAPIETDTWLCTYVGAPTEGLRNDQAQRRVDIEALRRVLHARFVQSGAREFDEYLRDQCQHLHYEPLPGARPWSFGVGYLWRLAVAWPGCAVPPCIHRAPRELGQRRLLLIS